MIVSAGEFERIYDPSVGEAEQWYVVTHAEPMDPHNEVHLAHATAPAAVGGLAGRTSRRWSSAG